MSDHIQRLTDILDKWKQGTVAEPADSEFVAQHFILPNFLAHFADDTDLLIHARRQRLTADFTYGDLLRIWSANSNNPEARTELERLLQQLMTEEEWGSSQYDPWRCIDRWMLLHIFVNRLQQSQDLPLAHCWRLQLEVFNKRSKHFEAAFRTWMERGGAWLNSELNDLVNKVHSSEKLEKAEDTPTSKTNDRKIRRKPIHQKLAKIPSSILQQCQAVAIRRAENYEELRRRTLNKYELDLPKPLDDEWLRSVASGFTKAAHDGDDFAWDADNQTKLRQLLAWIRERDIERGNPAPIEPLLRLARLPPPVTIAWSDLTVSPKNPPTLNEMRAAWGPLMVLVGTRWLRKGYRKDWGDHHRVLEDLFCHPLMMEFKFDKWRSEFEF